MLASSVISETDDENETLTWFDRASRSKLELCDNENGFTFQVTV